MCGLVVSFSSSSDLQLETTTKMMRLGAHRGPDGLRTVGASDEIGISEDPNGRYWVALGHARLSILDLSNRGAQPFISPDNRYGLVFNGEIYNYIEVKSELNSLGFSFTSTGDTEVLLFALIAWGQEALAKLRGMFSFVFIDFVRHRAIAARDRYGIKPLYLWKNGEQIHFASEIKQFTCCSGWKPKLNTKFTIEYLLYGSTDHSKDTMFENVLHVEPGTYLEVDLGRNLNIKRVKWWNPERKSYSGSYTDACGEFRELFRESLGLHLRSDVAIGSCLSGGLDSSAIVGATNQWFKDSVTDHKTFTAISADQNINEELFAQVVNRATGSQGYQVLPTAERLMHDLDKLTWHQDEPFGSTSIFAQWCVFSKIQETGVKVVLDGQGADEQLAGYNSSINVFLADKFVRGRWLSLMQQFSSFKTVGRASFASVASSLAYAYLPHQALSLVGKMKGIPSQNAGNWLNQGTVKLHEINDPFRQPNGYPRSVRALSVDMVDRINLPMLLRYEDRNSMAFGVEARVPFVDHHLLEFVLSLPEEYLLKDGTTKRVMRDALQDCIPSAILERRDKIGFQTAEQSWLANNETELMGVFDQNRGRASDIFTTSTREVLVDTIRGNSKFNNSPWRVIGLLNWMKVFDVAS